MRKWPYILAAGALAFLNIVASSNLYGAVLYHVTDLGTLGGAANYSQANGINNSGVIVGISTNSSGQNHGFSYSAGVMTDLGDLGGGISTGNAINSTGTIAGYSYNASNVFHAITYASGVMTDLGNMPSGKETYGWAINDSGTVAGNGNKNSGVHHAFSRIAGGPTSDP